MVCPQFIEDTLPYIYTSHTKPWHISFSGMLRSFIYKRRSQINTVRPFSKSFLIVRSSDDYPIQLNPTIGNTLRYFLLDQSKSHNFSYSDSWCLHQLLDLTWPAQGVMGNRLGPMGRNLLAQEGGSATQLITSQLARASIRVQSKLTSQSTGHI